MANLTRIIKSSQCVFCATRAGLYDITTFTVPFHRQLRGKRKQSREPITLTVRLLQDVSRFGPKGAIIPVLRGPMRNVLYPSQQAEYIDRTELRELRKQNLIGEKDPQFGIEQPDIGETEETKETSETNVNVQVELLSPQRASEVISSSLPPTLFFYRPTISDPEPEQKPHEPSNPGFRRRNSSAAADLAAASAVSPKTERVPIYGSVSSADIIESVKAALAETEEGARVVLGPEDVTIIRSDGEASDIDADRFKTLGNFEVDIRVKGGDAVRRTVSINPQEV